MKSLQEQRNEMFYSYIGVREKDKRSCLKCSRVFKSEGAGHRTCSVCVEANKSIGRMGAFS